MSIMFHGPSHVQEGAIPLQLLPPEGGCFPLVNKTVVPVLDDRPVRWSKFLPLVRICGPEDIGELWPMRRSELLLHALPPAYVYRVTVPMASI